MIKRRRRCRSSDALADFRARGADPRPPCIPAAPAANSRNYVASRTPRARAAASNSFRTSSSNRMEIGAPTRTS
jgi:hypothetical protein